MRPPLPLRLLLLLAPTTLCTRRVGPSGTPRPQLTKLGTVDIASCETTPLVINGSLWRFESVHSAYPGNVDTQRPKRSYFRFVQMDVEAGAITQPFAWRNELGCAYTEEGSSRVWAFGTYKGESTNEPGEITAFWSDDGMRSWESKVVLVGNATALKTVWNTSVHRGPDGTYIMAIETELFGSFTVNFATSKDLLNWEILNTTTCGSSPPPPLPMP